MPTPATEGQPERFHARSKRIFFQLRHALSAGASLKEIVEFGLVFLPVLARSCSQLLHIAFNGTFSTKEHVFYGTGNSEVV
jgi:hypothetical protein